MDRNLHLCLCCTGPVLNSTRLQSCAGESRTQRINTNFVIMEKRLGSWKYILSFSVWSMNNFRATMMFGLLFSITSCFPTRDSDVLLRVERNWRNPQKITERWERPCGFVQPRPLPGTQRTTRRQSLPQHFENIWRRAQHIKTTAAILKDSFVSSPVN